ncbi:hypothetical protein [Pseudonocardia parietis]|uniref:Transcriptional regulator with XRE-family HTH domain n=1 Tax=Pseudonocardia parietis TaxID=570936 RepID=A0ABS4W5A9_9PSEU|nr:hypothetical protein [Pseudonocardia parietis]MBP2371400.1 transcriptional regulator with XRE-family HTH domain [Pseudonocardia parietis]
MADEHSTQAANGARSESAKRVASSRPAAESTANSGDGPAVVDEAFVDRLNNLFAAVLQANGQEYSVSYAVRWVNATGGGTSRERINALRKGKPVKDLRPDSDEAAKIAAFFRVPTSYFLDPVPPEIDGAEQNRLIQQRLSSYRRGTIPQRVYYLFTTVVQADGRPYPATDVARWINANGGKITNVYIQKLASGERGERPQASYLQWIGKFFGVGLSFFYDEDPPEIDGQYQNAIIMLRDPDSAELQQLYGRLSPLQQEGVRQLMITLARDNDPTFVEPQREHAD